MRCKRTDESFYQKEQKERFANNNKGIIINYINNTMKILVRKINSIKILLII